MEYLQENQIKKKMKNKRKKCLDLFKYLKLDKPYFLNFPDNQLDKIPLLKLLKRLKKYWLILNPI